MANKPDFNLGIGVEAIVDTKKIQTEIDKQTKNIDINVNVKVDKTEAQKAVQKVFDKEKLDKQGREYFTKTTGILKQVKDYYKKNGAISIDISNQQKANGQIKSFTATVTEATGVIKKFNYERAKINTGGAKPNYGFVQTDNVSVLDKLSGSKLKQTDDFLSRIQNRISDINSKSFNQSKPLLSTENSDKYNALLTTTQSRITDITNSTKVLSDDHKREIGTMIGDLDRYRKELQNVEYAGTKLKPDTFSDSKAILQSQLETNIQKWDSSKVFDGDFKKNVLDAKSLLDNATNPEGLDKYRAKLKLLNEDFKKLNISTRNDNNSFNLSSNKLQLSNKLSSYLNENTKLSKGLKNEILNIQQALSKVDNKSDLDKLKQKFKEVTTTAKSLDQVGKNSFDKFKGDLGNFTTFLGAGTVIMSSVNSVRQLISTITELDSSLVDLQQATGANHEEAQKLLNTYIDLGQELGATGTEVAASASEWLRQGKSIAETNALIKDSMILSKIGQIDSAQATQYLTSAMKGYKVEVSGVLGIVDKLSAIDMSSATNVSGLAEGMSRVANMADNVGVSMDKLLSYLATVGEVTQKDMSSIGEAFQTMFSRMGNIKIKKFVDDETGESLSDTESVLNKLGVTLRNTDGSFKNFGDVLDVIGGKWNSYTQVEQNALGVAISGVRQRENFTVLMNNYAKSLEYAGISATSSGTAMKKFEAYSTSVESKVKTLQASLQELSTDTLDSGVIKSFLDASNVMVKATDDVGLFNIAIVALMTAMNVKKGTVLLGFIDSLVTKMGIATGTATTLSFALSAIVPTVAILGGIALVNELVVTTSELKDQVDSAKESYESTKSELESINTELATQNTKMNELLSKEKLTYAEKGQLDELKEITKELQIQADLAEKGELSSQKELAIKSADLVNRREYGVSSISNQGIQNAFQDLSGQDANYLNGEYANVIQTEDVSLLSLIAAYKEYSKLKQDAYNEQNNELTSSYGDIVSNITDSVWENVSALQEQKSNMKDYYDTIVEAEKSGETLTSDQKKVKKAYEETASAIELIYSVIDPNKLKQITFDDVFNSDSFANAKKELLSLANAGTLSPETLTSTDEYKKLLTDTGLSAKEASDQINAMATSGDGIVNNTTALKSYKDIIDGVSSKIKLVTDAQYELSKSGYLNYDTVSKLLETYPELEDSLSVTENGYTVTKGALDGLIDSELSQYKLELDNAMNTAEEVFNAEIKKQKGYDGTVESLKKIAEARIALAKQDVLDQQKNYSNLGIGMGGLSSYQPYLDAVDALNQYQSALDGVSNSQTNLNNAKGIIGQVKTSTTNDLSGKGKTSQIELPQGYQDDRADLEHRRKMGLTDKQYFAELQGLENEYLKGHKEYQSEIWAIDEAIYSHNQDLEAEKNKKKDEEIQGYFDNLENQLSRGLIKEDDYYKQLNALNEKYYKNDKDHLSDYQSNQEKYFNWLKEKRTDAIKSQFDNEKSIIDNYDKAYSSINDLASSYDDGSTQQLEVYTKGIAKAKDEISYLQQEINKLNGMKNAGYFADNLDLYDEQLKTLTDALYNAKNAISDFQESISKNVQSQLDNTTKSFEDSYEKQVAAIEKQRDAYADIINSEKELLDLKEKQRDYEKDIADKTKDISKIESRMSDLKRAASTGDRAAQAELNKLSEDVAGKKDDLAETQHDHEVDLQKDALDKALDDNNKLVNQKLEDEQDIQDKKLDDINVLYQKEMELIAQSSNYTKEQFATALNSINTDLAKLGVNVDPNNTKNILDAQGNIAKGSGNEVSNPSSTDTLNEVAIRAALMSGTGIKGDSDLNKHIHDNYGSYLTYSEMVNLAKLLKVSGISKVEDVKEPSNRNKILQALKKKGFTSGGTIGKTTSSGSLGELLKLSGENVLIPAKTGEGVLTEAQNIAWLKLVPQLTNLSNVMTNFKTPDISSFVTNKTNNSSPIINFNLNGGTITQEAMPQFNQWKKDIISDIVYEINKR